MAIKENPERRFYFVDPEITGTKLPMIICDRDCTGVYAVDDWAFYGERPIDENGMVARCQASTPPSFRNGKPRLSKI